MLANMLKELIGSLSILVVNKEDEVTTYIGKKYLKYCKKLNIVETLTEAQKICDTQKIDLLVINTDRFGKKSLKFIEENIKKYPEKAIIVSSRRFEDTSTLVKLTNIGVAGFISKALTIEEIFPMLLRVCTKSNEYLMMEHYITDLERQILEALAIPCQESCPRKSTLTRHLQSAKIPIIDDSFDFSPTPTLKENNVSSVQKAEPSIYQDYFSYLMGDDRDELHDILTEIDVLLLNASTRTLVHDSYQTGLLGEMLNRFGNTLMHYQFFSDTGLAIIELGKTFVTHCESMGSKEKDFDAILSGFCSVLQNFMDEVWGKEAENPKFFNDSIINDAQMICSLIIPSHSNHADDDDLIFF